MIRALGLIMTARRDTLGKESRFDMKGRESLSELYQISKSAKSDHSMRTPSTSFY